MDVDFERMTRKAYYPVHIVPCDPKPECPMMKLEEVGEGKCIAVCTASDRVLTRSAVQKCLALWRDCPFYRLAAESGAG